jgi:phosphoglycolate phosphatase-like HAD superfamily hydrolase
MTGAKVDWGTVRLVVFDVDGTLYDQKAMRLRMLREIVSNAIWTRSLITLRVLRIYRQLREAIGEQEVHNFGDVLVARTVEQSGMGGETVREIVAEWMEKRPLAHVRDCRYPHVTELFAALKRGGKTIGIWWRRNEC